MPAGGISPIRKRTQCDVPSALYGAGAGMMVESKGQHVSLYFMTFVCPLASGGLEPLNNTMTELESLARTCLKFYEDNKKAVADFARPWRNHQKAGSSFSCFYNTKDHRTIIVAKMHTKSDVIHSMLWPGLVIVVCGVIFLRLEMKRRGMGFCDINQMPGVPGSGPTKPTVVRNGDSGPQVQAHGQPEVKRTLLRVDNDGKAENVECLLLKSPTGGLSNSMPGLDKLKPVTVADGKRKPSRPAIVGPWSEVDDPRGSSLSVDGLRLQRIRSAEDGTAPSSNPLLLPTLLPTRRTDGSKTDCASSFTGSQGSKVMGLETPV
ncbi:hypothetical protein LSH36_350g02006 [Paralvinella palmiformis]|uniref:Uncharacterized protein n=1 Tax=Paralvinella palmiformis TaxID=53620 RepID=A0AAD9JF63_9ANNE|nr:hypothetical protein LSH36_350g02006 [Paralvinella palmiformis]